MTDHTYVKAGKDLYSLSDAQKRNATGGATHAHDLAQQPSAGAAVQDAGMSRLAQLGLELPPVGTRIRAYWSNDRVWYTGCVSSVMTSSFTMRYDVTDRDLLNWPGDDSPPQEVASVQWPLENNHDTFYELLDGKCALPPDSYKAGRSSGKGGKKGEWVFDYALLVKPHDGTEEFIRPGDWVSLAQATGAASGNPAAGVSVTAEQAAMPAKLIAVRREGPAKGGKFRAALADVLLSQAVDGNASGDAALPQLALMPEVTTVPLKCLTGRIGVIEEPQLTVDSNGAQDAALVPTHVCLGVMSSTPGTYEPLQAFCERQQLFASAPPGSRPRETKAPHDQRIVISANKYTHGVPADVAREARQRLLGEQVKSSISTLPSPAEAAKQPQSGGAVASAEEPTLKGRKRGRPPKKAEATTKPEQKGEPETMPAVAEEDKEEPSPAAPSGSKKARVMAAAAPKKAAGRGRGRGRGRASRGKGRGKGTGRGRRTTRNESSDEEMEQEGDDQAASGEDDAAAGGQEKVDTVAQDDDVVAAPTDTPAADIVLTEAEQPAVAAAPPVEHNGGVKEEGAPQETQPPAVDAMLVASPPAAPAAPPRSRFHIPKREVTSAAVAAPVVETTPGEQQQQAPPAIEAGWVQGAAPNSGDVERRVPPAGGEGSKLTEEERAREREVKQAKESWQKWGERNPLPAALERARASAAAALQQPMHGLQAQKPPPQQQQQTAVLHRPQVASPPLQQVPLMAQQQQYQQYQQQHMSVQRVAPPPSLPPIMPPVALPPLELWPAGMQTAPLVSSPLRHTDVPWIEALEPAGGGHTFFDLGDFEKRYSNWPSQTWLGTLPVPEVAAVLSLSEQQQPAVGQHRQAMMLPPATQLHTLATPLAMQPTVARPMDDVPHFPAPALPDSMRRQQQQHGMRSSSPIRGVPPPQYYSVGHGDVPRGRSHERGPPPLSAPPQGARPLHRGRSRSAGHKHSRHKSRQHRSRSQRRYGRSSSSSYSRSYSGSERRRRKRSRSRSRERRHRSERGDDRAHRHRHRDRTKSPPPNLGAMHRGGHMGAPR